MRDYLLSKEHQNRLILYNRDASEGNEFTTNCEITVILQHGETIVYTLQPDQKIVHSSAELVHSFHINVDRYHRIYADVMQNIIEIDPTSTFQNNYAINDFSKDAYFEFRYMTNQAPN